MLILLLMILSFVKNGKTVDNKERNGGIREFESKGGGRLSAVNTLLGKLTVYTQLQILGKYFFQHRPYFVDINGNGQLFYN